MTEPFAPTTHVITTTRSRDGEPSSTSIVRETHYKLADQDLLLLNLNSLVLERGGYGDTFREAVRLEHYGTDAIANAVVALLRHCTGELHAEHISSDYSRRCEDFLRRAAAAMPPHLLEAPQQPRLTVVVNNPLEA